MLIPNSQFIPLPLSPLVTVSCFLSLWAYFCFVNKFISIIFSDSIKVVSFDICLSPSFSMIISRSIHVAANGIISLLLMAEKYSSVCVCVCVCVCVYVCVCMCV